MKDKDPLDLPKSVNKFKLLDADKSKLLLLELEHRLTVAKLEKMAKELLSGLLAWACHVEHESAVFSKVWDELSVVMKDLYLRAGCRLEIIVFVSPRPEQVLVDYSRGGCFVLVGTQLGDRYGHLKHVMTKLEVELEEPLTLDFYIADNDHEDKATVMSDSNMFECRAIKFFMKQRMNHKIPARISIDKVGEEIEKQPFFALCDRQPMPQLKDEIANEVDTPSIQDSARGAGSGAASSSQVVSAIAHITTKQGGAEPPVSALGTVIPPTGHGGSESACC